MGFDVGNRECRAIINLNNNSQTNNGNLTNNTATSTNFNSLLVGNDNWNGTVPVYQRNYSDCPNDKRYFNAK